jgi:small subunit ribosomal protein S20
VPSEKTQRSADRRSQRNRPIRRRARTLVAKAEGIIRAGSDFNQAEVTVREATSALDNASGKGIIHPNNAARRKSRLMKKLNKASMSTSSDENKTEAGTTSSTTNSRSRRTASAKAK